MLEDVASRSILSVWYLSFLRERGEKKEEEEEEEEAGHRRTQLGDRRETCGKRVGCGCA